MSFLTREQFTGLNDLHSIEVELPDNQGKVRIRALSSVETELLNKRTEEGKLSNIAAACLACTYAILDADGQRMFDPGNQKDLELLKTKSPAIILHLNEVILRLSAAGKAEVEKYLKNWKKTQPEDSSSGSAST